MTDSLSFRLSSLPVVVIGRVRLVDIDPSSSSGDSGGGRKWGRGGGGGRGSDNQGGEEGEDDDAPRMAEFVIHANNMVRTRTQKHIENTGSGQNIIRRSALRRVIHVRRTSYALTHHDSVSLR